MNLVRAPFLGMLRRADHGLVQRPRGICTHSEFTRQQLKAIYGRDSHLCHYGIDPVKYQRIAARRTNTVLSVGAVHWRKGHEEAIRTVAAVDSDIRPAVIIAGQISDAREADYLLRLAGDAGVQVEIRIDSVNDQELVRLYSEARALLCLAYGEPFGLTPLECMACGTPVIAVDEGGFKETVVEGETGYLVGRDIAGSAERLTRLLRSPELSDQMGKRGVEHVRKNWTWEKGMAELEGAIGSAMCAERGSVGHPVQTPAETLPRPTICGE
jgi:glycosyltransferase involved in cell wall biosynthesis